MRRSTADRRLPEVLLILAVVGTPLYWGTILYLIVQTLDTCSFDDCTSSGLNPLRVAVYLLVAMLAYVASIALGSWVNHRLASQSGADPED